jgi:translation initiation factor 3 subunit C
VTVVGWFVVDYFSSHSYAFDVFYVAHEFDARRRMISKNFHHVLRVSERQPLVGPPESMREHVVAACKAMKIGDWTACCNFIINDKMNTKVCMMRS